MSSKERIKERVEQLQRYTEAYYNNIPLVDDYVFDALLRELTEWAPNHPFLESVGAAVIKGSSFDHTAPMLSTAKALNDDDLQNFVARVYKESKDIGVVAPTFRVTPKLDGMAGKYIGGILATRGNGRVGSVVTHILKEGVVAKGGKNTGVGEIVMTQSYFDEHLQGIFTHPRNVVVGCVNSDTIRDEIRMCLNDKQVHFVPYSTLPNWTGTGAELVENVKTISKDLAEKVDYPLDGMVAEVVQQNVKDHMGATNHHNRWQIAIKEEGEVAETTILSIGWQTGRTGVVTPVLRVEPREVDGAVISNISAHNAGNVQKLKLGKGAVIEIIRSGFVIPKLKNVLKEANEVIIPSKCPRCDGEVEWDNDFIRCININQCPAMIETSILYFFKTIENAKGFGKKTIERLVDNGHVTLEGIFSLKKDAFINMEFGNKQSENLEQALQDAIHTEIEDARFLASFGIQNLGIGASRKLLSVHRFEELRGLSAQDIDSIDGFGETTSPLIARILSEKWQSIEAIKGLGFTLKTTPLTAEVNAIESPIAGKTILFTGKMTQNRDDMQEQARGLGATVLSSVSSKLQILVIGEKASTSKVAKARKNGTQVLTEKEYGALLL